MAKKVLKYTEEEFVALLENIVKRVQKEERLNEWKRSNFGLLINWWSKRSWVENVKKLRVKKKVISKQLEMIKVKIFDYCKEWEK